jgi:hypothetical protein
VFRRQGLSLEGPRLTDREAIALVRGAAWRVTPTPEDGFVVWMAPTDEGIAAARMRWPEESVET